MLTSTGEALVYNSNKLFMLTETTSPVWQKQTATTITGRGLTKN